MRYRKKTVEIDAVPVADLLYGRQGRYGWIVLAVAVLVILGSAFMGFYVWWRPA